MGSLKALFTAGLVIFATTASAAAADLFLPPPPPIDPVYVPVEFSSGFYLRGDIGAGITQLRGGQATFENTSGFLTASGGKPSGFSRDGDYADPDPIVGVGVGYQFNSYFRADLTGDYRFGNYHSYETSRGCFPSDAAGNTGLCDDRYSSKFSSAVVLANGYFDMGTWYRITPYIGAGVGVARNTFGTLNDYNLNFFGNLSGQATSKSTFNLAYALMAGFAYDLTPNLKLDFGYRYLDMGRISSNAIVCDSTPCFFERQSFHLASHDIRLGVRYVFNDPVEPPAFTPPPPLVRKY